MSCKVKGYFPDDEERTAIEEPIVLLTRNCVLRLFYLLSREYKTPLKEIYSYDDNNLVSMIQEHEKLYYDTVNVLKEGPEPCLDSIVKAFKTVYKDLSNYDWRNAKRFSEKFNNWCCYVRTQDDWKDIIQVIVDKQTSPVGSVALSNSMYTSLCRNHYCTYEDVANLIQLLRDEPNNTDYNSFYEYTECHKDIIWNDTVVTVIHGILLTFYSASSRYHEAVLFLFPKLINFFNIRQRRIKQGHHYFLPVLTGQYITGRVANIFAIVITADIDLYLKCVKNHVFDGITDMENMHQAILSAINDRPALTTRTRYNLAKVRDLVKQYIDKQFTTNMESRFKRIDYTYKDVDDIVRKAYSFSYLITQGFHKSKGMDVSPFLIARKKLFQSII